MTPASLKPLLIVLSIGLLAILAAPILNLEAGSSRLGITARFERLVNVCQDDHPDWDRDVCEGIVRGDLWVGMTVEMVRASLGEPRHVQRPDDEDPAHEVWTYYTAQYGVEVLQVEDGLLTGWGPPSSGCTTCGVIRARP
jgi:hypothetical protein